MAENEPTGGAETNGMESESQEQAEAERPEELIIIPRVTGKEIKSYIYGFVKNVGPTEKKDNSDYLKYLLKRYEPAFEKKAPTDPRELQRYLRTRAEHKARQALGFDKNVNTKKSQDRSRRDFDQLNLWLKEIGDSGIDIQECRRKEEARQQEREEREAQKNREREEKRARGEEVHEGPRPSWKQVSYQPYRSGPGRYEQGIPPRSETRTQPSSQPTRQPSGQREERPPESRPPEPRPPEPRSPEPRPPIEPGTRVMWRDENGNEQPVEVLGPAEEEARPQNTEETPDTGYPGATIIETDDPQDFINRLDSPHRYGTIIEISGQTLQAYIQSLQISGAKIESLTIQFANDNVCIVQGNVSAGYKGGAEFTLQLENDETGRLRVAGHLIDLRGLAKARPGAIRQGLTNIQDSVLKNINQKLENNEITGIGIYRRNFLLASRPRPEES